MKGAGALWASDHDTRSFAARLQEGGVSPDTPILVVDQKKNALPVYGYRNLTWVRGWNRPYPFFSPPAALETALADLQAESPERFVVILAPDRWAALEAELPPALAACEEQAGEGYLLFRCSD